MIFSRTRKTSAATRRISKRLDEVTVPDMLFRFLLDSGLTEAQQLQTLLGLSPLPYPEREARESDLRLKAVSPMMPFVALCSTAMSSAVVDYIRTVDSDSYSDIPDEAADSIADLISRVAMSNTIGILTQLYDLGFLDYTYMERS